MEVSNEELALRHPFTLVASGSTGSGKTEWIKKLLQNTLIINPPPQKIVYFYSIWQKAYDEMRAFNPDITFIEGVPTVFPTGLQRELWILDDLQAEIEDSKDVIVNLFTKGSHHKNVSIVLILQNFFNKGKSIREITLNAHYLVLFKNVRDRTQIRSLGLQMFPTNVKFLQSAYEQATQKPFTYLFVDLKPETREQLRLRGNLFSGNQEVYIPV